MTPPVDRAGPARRIVTNVALDPGDAISLRFTKWDRARHWEFDMLALGSDQHGIWAGASAGTRLSRPGNTFDSEHDWVTLVPHDQPWAASFYDSPEQHVSIYVDMTTPAEWSGHTVSMVDLDLDVVLRRGGSLFIDDEDEFEVHRRTMSYPNDLVATARRTAEDVRSAIAAGAEPFASVGTEWLRLFRRE